MLSALLALAGCSSTVTMVPDKSVPFATGEIDASIEENGNGTVAIRVSHLGPPEKLDPSAKVYVVWLHAKKDKAAVQNMGVLKIDEDYEGSHTFTTTFRHFEVRITPEPAASAITPTGRDILRGAVSAD